MPMTADYYVRPTNGLDTNDGLTWATAFQTVQKALDVAVAGKVVNCAAEAEETLAAAVDDDTNSGSTTGNLIKLVGCNAAGERDGTRYVLNANSVAANCLKINGRTYKKYVNFQFKNATGTGILFATTASNPIFFENCIANNNGLQGFDSSIANSLVLFYRCQIYSNTGIGAGQTAVFIKYIVGCSIFLNGYGIGSQSASDVILNTLIYKNTTMGITGAAAAPTIIGNTIDGNGTGILFTSVAGAKILFNRITNNTTGISITSGLVMEDYNYYFNNGTKFSTTTGKINSGNNSVDMAAAGYVNQPANNYSLVNGATPAEGRFLAYVLDATNTDYSSIGLEPNPDFPAAGNVWSGDTTDGVTGTEDQPALSKVAPTDTLRGSAGTMDLPALNKVRPDDTLEGVAGTNVILATDADYLALEATRNITAGAANILVGAHEHIAGAQIDGALVALAVPAAPTNLVFTNITDNGFRVSWTPGARSETYKVYVDGVLHTAGISDAYLDIGSRAALTPYSITVKGTNVTGDGAASAAYTVTTLASDAANDATTLSTDVVAVVAVTGSPKIVGHGTAKVFDPRIIDEALDVNAASFYWKDILENSGKTVITR